MMTDKKRGRPATSSHVRVTPEFRPEPDVEKLGRVLISIAVSIAEKKKTENVGSHSTVLGTGNSIEIRTYPMDRKGDGMT